MVQEIWLEPPGAGRERSRSLRGAVVSQREAVTLPLPIRRDTHNLQARCRFEMVGAYLVL